MQRLPGRPVRRIRRQRCQVGNLDMSGIYLAGVARLGIAGIIWIGEDRYAGLDRYTPALLDQGELCISKLI